MRRMPSAPGPLGVEEKLSAGKKRAPRTVPAPDNAARAAAFPADLAAAICTPASLTTTWGVVEHPISLLEAGTYRRSSERGTLAGDATWFGIDLALMRKPKTENNRCRGSESPHLTEWQMSIDFKPAESARPRLDKASTLARLALIAVVLAAVVGTFAYLGGWFTPNDLTPARFTDGFEQVDGLHAGFRRNHAKGVGVSGFFESNGNGVRLSKAAVFQAGRVPVIGRFSLGGGQPYAADKPDTVRGLGLQFSPPTARCGEPRWSTSPCFPSVPPRPFTST